MVRIFPNEAAQAVVGDLVRKAKQSVYDASPDLYKNKVDPFSALIDSMLQGIPLSNWIAQEKVRQSQKTLQNCIGDFHQSVIASFDGWEDLGTGQIIDIKNKKQKVVAEIKNKYTRKFLIYIEDELKQISFFLDTLFFSKTILVLLPLFSRCLVLFKTIDWQGLQYLTPGKISLAFLTLKLTPVICCSWIMRNILLSLMEANLAL